MPATGYSKMSIRSSNYNASTPTAQGIVILAKIARRLFTEIMMSIDNKISNSFGFNTLWYILLLICQFR